MNVPLAVSVLVLISSHLEFSEQDPIAELAEWTPRHKRQIGDDLCYIPDPLKNGFFFPHLRRCPPGDNSASCRLVPGTAVNTGWVIRYECDLGYQLNTTRIASICLRKSGEARWLPPLPVCLESYYSSHFLPTKNVCGKPSRNVRTKRRVDGTISKRGAWPWMVIFGHNKTNNPNDGVHWFCAGTLITTRHILTAANCMATHRNRPVFVARLDDLNLEDSVRDGAQPINIPVEKRHIIVHPGYERSVVFSDNIAVVKLRSDIRITDYVRPICLPTPDFKDRGFSGETVYFTSWGQTDNDREISPKRKRRFEPILHEITARIIDHDVCNDNYRHYQTTDTPLIISDQLICAAVNINKSCQGDIGSPLMLKYKGTYFLVGIVATEYRCFDDAFPRVFTKLSEYMDWVVGNLF